MLEFKEPRPYLKIFLHYGFVVIAVDGNGYVSIILVVVGAHALARALARRTWAAGPGR